MAEDQSDLSCPFCNTLRASQPNLEFLYSTCCGFLICKNCISRQLFVTSRRVSCQLCGVEITSRSFVKETLDRQQYKKETNTRARLNKVFNMRRDDFKTLGEYNDYLETVQDIVFDLTYGSKSEQIQAEKKVLEYERKHREQIQRNYGVQQQSSSSSSSSSLSVASSSSSSALSTSSTSVSSLAAVMSEATRILRGPARTRPVKVQTEEEKKAVYQAWKTKPFAERLRIKTIAGFSREQDVQRSLAAARDSLLF
eukprot:TRINITY_DN375_c1_g1_i1.p1 TRINITY_DN375_c1_g1~~TRINITY_DN375_c1_g1_i1.p1  ORF type:complete len:254 (+),score=51.42 TRINITY_DN375_c1_g1_i1:89-850(+)